MRIWGKVVPVLVALAMVVLGVRLFVGPREDVAVPPDTASPQQVVETYGKAMNARDFATVEALKVPGTGGPVPSRWSLHAPVMKDLHVVRASEVAPGEANSLAAGWEQSVTVDTTLTRANMDGTTGEQADQPWSFILVRHAAADPWRIIDQGQG